MNCDDTGRSGGIGRMAPYLTIAMMLGATGPQAAVAAPEASAAPAAAVLDADDWRADLEFARAEMPKRHANLFHTLEPARYEAAFDRLLADVDRLQEHEIVLGLAEIAAAVGDGHSRLTLPIEAMEVAAAGHTGTAPSRARTFRRLPLRLSRTAEGYVVTRATAEERRLLGTRVVAIDGQDVATVEAAIAPLIQRDNDHQLHDWLPWFMVVPEVLQARRVSPSLESSRWQFVDALDHPVGATLRPVPVGTNPEWVSLPASKWPAGVPSDQRSLLWFADVARPDSVYVRIGEIGDASDRTFERFAADLQAHLAATTLRTLILDLRGNPGGDNSLNPPLVRALLRVPWVSEPGALYVLVDGGTLSAAMNLAQDLERWLPAVFVGSGTGARPNTYGDARKLVLPRSGLTLRLSSLFWQNHPNDQRAAIEPLIAAPRSIADLREGRDPVAAALDRLDEASEPVGRWVGELSAGFRQLPVELDLTSPAGDGPGRMTVRELGVESVPITAVEGTGGTWRGEIVLAARPATVAARMAGDRMVGWVEYRGTRFPFVVTRQ